MLILPLFTTSAQRLSDDSGAALIGADVTALRNRIAAAKSKAMAGAGVPVEDVESMVESLSGLGVPRDETARRELAKSWRDAAELARTSEGDCPLFYESIRTAASLDPDDSEIAYEAEFQRRRQNLFEQRVAAAAAERARRAAQ